MKYLFLLWQDPAKAPAMGSPEMNEEFGAYDAFYKQAAAAGIFQAGDPLQPADTGQTVSGSNGSAATATGSFSTSAEQLIGFYVLDCTDDDDAASWAAKIPAARRGTVEVRPVLSM